VFVVGDMAAVEGGEENEPCFLEPFHERPPPFANPAIRPGLIWALRRMFFPVV
jgi:hypothetical protein